MVHNYYRERVAVETIFENAVLKTLRYINYIGSPIILQRDLLIINIIRIHAVLYA